MALIRRPEGHWPQENKSENLTIIKYIYPMYFIVGFVLQWIHCDQDLQRIAELDTSASRTITQCLRFGWDDAFHKAKQNFIKILRHDKFHSGR